MMLSITCIATGSLLLSGAFGETVGDAPGPTWVGFQGEPALTGRKCRSAPASFCDNAYKCVDSPENAQVWWCESCEDESTTFNACRIEEGDCTPSQTLTNCGDWLEAFAVKELNKTCAESCTPSSVMGDCRDAFPWISCSPDDQ